jgi:putative transcriptional regulator
MSRFRSAVTITWITVLLALAAPLGNAAALGERLAKGVFLVATPQLHGSSFERTVILITEYGPQGASGITINRPSGHRLSEFYPAFKEPQLDGPLYLGGPVRPLNLFVLTQSNPGNGWYHVIDDVYVGGGPIAFSYLQQRPGADGPIRTYAGYAGWAPNQLENEIERNDWIVIKAETRIIFEAAQDEAWEHLYRRWSGNWI